MKISGWQVALLISTVVWLIPTSGECMKFDETTAPVKHQEIVRVFTSEETATSLQEKASVKTQEDCLSYVQVYDNIEEDPEHAEANKITASYAIQ